ncbi:MAG: recombinase family protein [Candidatus Thiodiazotropha sp. (ex Lucinoma kastoroae)]|nr:recombinase family protein [Candidatus Thiodiazotropha sp. (ex Lucinoma kastoroae)]
MLIPVPHISLQVIFDEITIEDDVLVTDKKRPVYNEAMKSLRAEYVFVISSIDKAFRSTLDALSELDKLHQHGV